MYQVKEKERIFIYTGPDGSGRKTLAKMVATAFDMETVLSYTTRPPRHYETNNEDYHFVSEEAFQQMQQQNEFLESVDIDGYCYGIREKDIVDAFQGHDFVYLAMNPDGAEKLKQMFGKNVVRIFIYADRDTVIKRQKERQDNEAEIRRHMTHYDDTMNYKNQCEHAFENYDLPQVSFQISELIESYLDRDYIVSEY
ncbi:guanylate kinase [Pseudalkalibacillus decolorationis]|uniref:guanylate kinase n=1 Tax=Pseudalkalibacillus decolorationis TaxID=163879 RepID=UPI002147F559|nr:guanylate kinase [Pseudalkalibacillus decolorationis]